MRKKTDIFAALGLSALAGLVCLFGFPSGTAGIAIVFIGMVVSPGYLLLRLLSYEPLDPWETYPLSLVMGVLLFGLVGMAMFLLMAPVYAGLIVMPIIALALFLWFFVFSKREHTWEKGWYLEPCGVGLIFAAVVFISLIIAWKLGSFRGWAVEWDYYTYITMVRRLVTRGFAANFPIAFANEGSDPVHSYNIWALMWAAISTGLRMDPVTLYVKSGFLTIPAAILAFYALSGSFFERRAAMASTVIYSVYHFAAMGFILLGRCSYYNSDPAWLIFFPICIKFVHDYMQKGGSRRLASSAGAVLITFLVHPLWGVLAGVAAAMTAVVTLLANRGHIGPVYGWNWRVGWFLLVLPVVWAVYKLLVGVPVQGVGGTPSFWEFAAFVMIPVALWLPFLYRSAANNPRQAKRVAALVGAAIVVSAPFALLRVMEATGARPEEFSLVREYNRFITPKLFVLHPLAFSYTAPDMTLYPWSVLGLLALPWLILRYAKGDRALLVVIVGTLFMGFVAFHPYLAWIFGKTLHVAYLRRALRFSAMFAALGAGAGIWALSGMARRWAGLALIAAALVFAVAAAWYPVRPDYFRGAAGKSWFIMTKAPTEGLFWHHDENAHKKENVTWDTERFAGLLDDVPLRHTVTSDVFTSYRLTAYRDVYVIDRLKPSTGAMDSAERERDASALVTAAGNNEIICNIMRKYDSRRLLVNAAPGYKLRGYYLWHPRTVKAILNSGKYFQPLSSSGPWLLFEATPGCVP